LVVLVLKRKYKKKVSNRFDFVFFVAENIQNANDRFFVCVFILHLQGVIGGENLNNV